MRFPDWTPESPQAAKAQIDVLDGPLSCLERHMFNFGTTGHETVSVFSELSAQIYFVETVISY